MLQTSCPQLQDFQNIIHMLDSANLNDSVDWQQVGVYLIHYSFVG